MDNNMRFNNDWERMSRMAERYKSQYPAGTRVLLHSMGNDPFQVEAGTKGTVVCVDDLGTVHCKFDNGRCLGLIPGEDCFSKVTE